MDLFIIGHTGFIGSYIYKYLLQNKNYNIIGISTENVDLTKKNSSTLLQEILSNGCTIILCAGVKKQLGDNRFLF